MSADGNASCNRIAAARSVLPFVSNAVAPVMNGDAWAMAKSGVPINARQINSGKGS
jgi:hypothetical protein